MEETFQVLEMKQNPPRLNPNQLKPVDRGTQSNLLKNQNQSIPSTRKPRKTPNAETEAGKL